MLRDCSSEAEMHWAREEDVPDDYEEEEEPEEEEHGMEEEVDLQQLCALSGQPGAQRSAFMGSQVSAQRQY